MPSLEPLDSDDRASTLARFVGGYADDDGNEVRIWAASSGNFESHTGTEVPDDATHVVEIVQGGEAVTEVFASDLEAAESIADQRTEALERALTDDEVAQ